MWSSTAESWRFKDCRNCLSLTPPQTAFCPSSSRIHRRVTQKKKHWRKHFSFLILSSPTTRVLGRQKLPSLNWLKAHHYQLTYDHLYKSKICYFRTMPAFLFSMWNLRIKRIRKTSLWPLWLGLDPGRIAGRTWTKDLQFDSSDPKINVRSQYFQFP